MRIIQPLFWALGSSILVIPTLALAYPGGLAVSTGTNPVQSFGGVVSSGSTVTVVTASADQDFVVTDIHLAPDTADHDCRVISAIELIRPTTGETVGRYTIGWETNRNSYAYTLPSVVDTHLSSGIKVPAGQSLNMNVILRYETHCDAWGIGYTLSGYHAQP